MSNFNTDDVNDLILKDLALADYAERIAELETENKKLAELAKNPHPAYEAWNQLRELLEQFNDKEVNDE